LEGYGGSLRGGKNPRPGQLRRPTLVAPGGKKKKVSRGDSQGDDKGCGGGKDRATRRPGNREATSEETKTGRETLN